MREVISAVSAYSPMRRMFGRELTPTEEERLVARMQPAQRAHYERGKAAFGLIEQIGERFKAPKMASQTTRRRRLRKGREFGFRRRTRNRRRRTFL